jgi:hypothetical protein
LGCGACPIPEPNVVNQEVHFIPSSVVVFLLIYMPALAVRLVSACNLSDFARQSGIIESFSQ